MKKDDLIELTIEDLGVDGEGIGKVDGMAIFVKDGAGRPGTGEGHEDEEELWLCQTDAGTGSVTRADGIKMCICPPVWRMSAAGHDL